MLVKVKEARYVSDYRVWVEFDSGEAGEVDLRDLVFKYPAAASLRDKERFAGFHLDGWPTLVWDCGFDVAPEDLYERATGKIIPWLHAPHHTKA